MGDGRSHGGEYHRLPAPGIGYNPSGSARGLVPSAVFKTVVRRRLRCRGWVRFPCASANEPISRPVRGTLATQGAPTCPPGDSGSKTDFRTPSWGKIKAESPAMNIAKSHCPRCGEKMPLVNFKASFQQILFGGWTCPKCGCETNSAGREKFVCCPKCGKAQPTIRIPRSIQEALWRGWTCRECGCQVDGKGKEVSVFPGQSRPQSPSDRGTRSGVKVQLLGVQRVRVATEQVRVPMGVTIKVRRSRAFEHTLEIDGKSTAEGTLGVGAMGVFHGSVRLAIEQHQGRAYQERESIEYEVELNGNQNSSYSLTWEDVWQFGHVEIQQDARGTQVLPIRFRESTELHVLPG
jgi:hypothetical protein